MALSIRKWACIVAAILLSLLTIRSFAFTANGHNVIEAAAYRHILEQANIERLSMIAGHPISGKDALDLLIAYRILDQPRGWREGHVKDPLNTLPIIRSGNLDYILSRQFEGNSQCFHFMARPSDVYWDTTTDPTYHYPHMLYDSAYPRCVAFLTTTFDLVLNNALAARSGNRDVYSLMHSIADSYCDAHTERDSNWVIYYCKVWEPTAYIPFLFHPSAQPFEEGPWGHKFTDVRDAAYWADENWRLSEGGTKADADVMDTTCSSSTNPYQVHEDCLSPRAKEAIAAIQELLIVLAENVLREHLYHGIDTAYERASWQTYLDTYFVGWKGTAQQRHLRPDEREWRPLIHAGLEYHSTTVNGGRAADATADFNIDIPIALIAPISPGIIIDAGQRIYPGHSPGSAIGPTANLLRIGYAMAFEFADDFEIRMAPFTREFTFGSHAGETRNLVSFFEIEGIIDRDFWFRLEAPRFTSSGFIPNDYGIAIGYSNGWDFGKWFSEHTGKDEPLALEGNKWTVPDSAGIQAAKLGSGKSISATIISMQFNPYGNDLYGASMQLMWDRNSSGERNKGFTQGGQLDWELPPSTMAAGTVTSGILDAAYVLRYYFNPHLAITTEPIEAVKAINATEQHPSGNLSWDARSTLGVTALLLHTDLTIGLATLSWRDAATGKNPFYQSFPAALRLALNFFVP